MRHFQKWSLRVYPFFPKVSSIVKIKTSIKEYKEMKIGVREYLYNDMDSIGVIDKFSSINMYTFHIITIHPERQFVAYLICESNLILSARLWC